MKQLLVLSVILAFTPLPAFAQAGTVAGVFVPPKVKLADTNMLNAGTGTVIVNVLVRANGTFRVEGVTHSTNPELNRIALDIARRSHYTPATKGRVPVVSLYKVRLNFSGNGLSRYETIIGTGAYSRAKGSLQGYLLKHPTDTRARFDLGLAEAFMGDDAGAVEAFEKAGPIPDKFKAVAGKAYASRAVALMKEKNYNDALPLAKKAVILAPNYQALGNLGFVELKTGDVASAVSDLVKARAAAAINKAPSERRADISVNLAAAYARQGDIPQAKAYAAEAAELDPADTAGYEAVRDAYAEQAETSLKASRYEEAGALYDQAASTAVAAASKATLYANAAFAYLQAKPKPASAHAKVEAEKALAIDPHHAGANFAEGIALADQGKRHEALTYLVVADTAAKAGTDPVLTQNIENAIARLNGSRKKRA
jgi:tetratricopeptide (TPR) repeat protein